MTESILRVANLQMRFGGIRALNDVNPDVTSGSITALIGANGAGKSTLLMSIFGQPRIAGGATGVSRYDGGGKFIDGQYRHRHPLSGRGFGAHVSPVSPAGGATRPACDDALRRRIANAGHRPRADEPAQAAVT
ncbi:putative branched-chain amino acid ABC transporter ATP-binding component [Sodalis glossinidius str. 'morsitans']|uniref:High-affinity branched-chain amino acid transport ATP-binding protein LivG n=1 Tax=Sodalis glossinidius (strain morsitans) TaxID=343509 RepID=Q2NWB1_SODGM|nr:putative branched-chain amino acid ABC transporter ATP-binding component [Sodalis glossinidius str. 'morsitans']